MDALIPVHEKDRLVLPACIESIREHCPEIDHITVLSMFNPEIRDVRWVCEGQTMLFPFDLKGIQAILGCDPWIARWYGQQLMKLYASAYMTGPRWLQCDAELRWQREVRFTDDAGHILLSHYCDPHWHEAYFRHASRLVPEIQFAGTRSLIAHHLVYSRAALDDLFRRVEAHHQKPFWRAYLECVDRAWVTKSGSAENELMSHFMLWASPDTCRIRDLRFAELKKYEDRLDLDFVSVQSWNRET